MVPSSSEKTSLCLAKRASRSDADSLDTITTPIFLQFNQIWANQFRPRRHGPSPNNTKTVSTLAGCCSYCTRTANSPSTFIRSSVYVFRITLEGRSVASGSSDFCTRSETIETAAPVSTSIVSSLFSMRRSTVIGREDFSPMANSFNSLASLENVSSAATHFVLQGMGFRPCGGFFLERQAGAMWPSCHKHDT